MVEKDFFQKSPSSFISVPAIDVLKGNFDSSLFDNTLVLIGATAFGLDDIVPTPYSGSSPGVELQARVLTSILDGEVPYHAAGWKYFQRPNFCSYRMFAVRNCSSAWKVGLVGLPLVAFSSSLFSLAIHGFLLTNYELWVGWLYSGMFGFIGGSLLLISEHARVRFERGLVMQNLASYLPSETARKLHISSRHRLFRLSAAK